MVFGGNVSAPYPEVLFLKIMCIFPFQFLKFPRVKLLLWLVSCKKIPLQQFSIWFYYRSSQDVIKEVMLSWRGFMAYWSLFFYVFWTLLWCRWVQRYIEVHKERLLRTRFLEWMIVPTIFAAVYVKAVGIYMNKPRAVKATYKRLYVVSAIEIWAM